MLKEFASKKCVKLGKLLKERGVEVMKGVVVAPTPIHNSISFNRNGTSVEVSPLYITTFASSTPISDLVPIKMDSILPTVYSYDMNALVIYLPFSSVTETAANKLN